MVAKAGLGALAVLIAFSKAFAVASAAQGSASDAGTMVLATGGGFLLAAAFAILFAIAGAGVFVVTLITAVAAAVFVGQFAIMLLLFFVMLPLTNALMDWLSWAVTRYILGFVARAPSGEGGLALVFALLFLDLTAAVLFFLVLSVVLPNSIELVNILFRVSGNAPFDWQYFAAHAVRAPWTEGLIVTGILLTSLAPTFVQWSWGLTGVLARFTPGSVIAAGRVTEHPDVTPTAAEAACVRRTLQRPGCGTSLRPRWSRRSLSAATGSWPHT